MIKRVTVVALFVAAFLVLAVPAMAFDGFRDTYINASECAACHDTGGMASPIYSEWAQTGHAQVGDWTAFQANAYPIHRGPGCAGCHSGNYDTQKAIPENPGAPAGDWVYPVANTPDDDAFSEPFVGCSSCHWGKNDAGNAGPTAAHQVPLANMANPDICGQCHARYSNSVEAYPNWDGTSAKREYTRGTFNPLGSPSAWTPAPLSDFLSVATLASPQRGRFWPTGQSALAHGQGAVQYNEWSQEGHANALEGLQRFVVPGNDAANAWLNECLDCHSEDYRMLKEAGTDVSKMTIEDFKYGVTCQTCHDSHVKGEQAAVWNEERHPQLTAPRQRLCVECHTAQIPAKANGRPGIATAGTTVHNPMKEMMDGTGAIDVPQGSPSVHKGRCVQCHMVPTGYDRTGIEATAGNHLFAIIEPEQAAETTMQLTFSGVPTTKAMPYSSCTTCHTQDGTKYGLYLQETLDDRQEAMTTWDGEVTVALEAAAKDLGFKGDAIANANSTLNDKKAAGGSWNASQLNFQKGFTNQTFVESEGSMGIHNWEYARTVILKALSQANAVSPVPVVTVKTSASSINANASVTISGVVNTATKGKVTIQSKKGNGSWSTWKTASLTSYGKYSSGAVKMTSKGTYHFRAKFGATAKQVGGTSAQVKVVVK